MRMFTPWISGMGSTSIIGTSATYNSKFACSNMFSGFFFPAWRKRGLILHMGQRVMFKDA